jgi:3'(2'), 5'-bisphosphate nucleotidase
MRQHLIKAINAAVEAGNVILDIYSNPNADFSVERKSDNSPLTIADKKSHIIIEERLYDTGIPILSEEGRNIEYEERKEWSQFWLIDPLDGTKEFIKRNGEFTVNIALIENNTPVMGIIYVPVSNELYFSLKDLGSYYIKGVKNIDNELDSLLKSSVKLPIANRERRFTVVASRSHMNSETEEFINRLKEKHSEIDFISRGSSLKICMVASGEADIYPRFAPTMEWDTAAGHAIAKYAGKKAFKADGSGELLYNKESLLNPYFIVR